MTNNNDVIKRKFLDYGTKIDIYYSTLLNKSR